MLLNWLIPNGSAIEKHPIYIVETRRQPQKSFSILFTHSLKWLVRSSLPILILWPLWAVYLYDQLSPYQIAAPAGVYSAVYFDTLWTTYTILLVASILPCIVLDLGCVLVTANSITAEKSKGYWDYLLVADVSPLDAVYVKHGLAQIYAWRTLMIVISLRIATFLLGIIQFLLLSILIKDTSIAPPIFNISRDLVADPIGVFAVLVGSGIYLIEPLWRMRTATAICLAISARGWQTNMTLLASYASVTAMWISQVILAGFVSGIISVHISNYVDHRSLWMVYVLVFSLLVYIYYRFIRFWSLRRAAAAAFRT